MVPLALRPTAGGTCRGYCSGAPFTYMSWPPVSWDGAGSPCSDRPHRTGSRRARIPAAQRSDPIVARLCSATSSAPSSGSPSTTQPWPVSAQAPHRYTAPPSGEPLQTASLSRSTSRPLTMNLAVRRIPDAAHLDLPLDVHEHATRSSRSWSACRSCPSRSWTRSRAPRSPSGAAESHGASPFAARR